VKTQPVTPAQIEFDADPQQPPRSPLYGDVYHPRIGAMAQARHVFLQGNGLPGRWAGRADFVVLELGFGLGNNFLATWDAWRRDPARCQRLHYVAVELHPPTAADLARAHAGAAQPDLAAALVQAWPPLTANLQGLNFEGGALRLSLALGDAQQWLPGLRLAADAIYLDGFAPARNPRLWEPRCLKALGRLAAPDATAATWSVATDVRSALVTAGFEVALAPGIGGKREITLARFKPRFAVQRPPDPACAADRAVVIGAGLAGAAVAQALARQGLHVEVLEARSGPALAASGNPAGIFHGSVNADEGTHARLFRAAAIAAQHAYGPVIASGAVAGSVAGLLRLAGSSDEGPHWQAVVQRAGLPPDYVQWLDRAAASALAGVPLPGPAWWYPGGGWLAPAAWVRHALAMPGVQLRCAAPVLGLRREGTLWQVLGERGQMLAQAGIVVLAQAEASLGLATTLGLPTWPLQRTRGQITQWSGPPSALRHPVAGDGYALPLPGGGVLCGATRQSDDEDPQLRQADHVHNLQRLQRLTGLLAPAGFEGLGGRVGWRLHSPDRLPLAGALPAWPWPAGQRADQARLLPRRQGLFVLTGLGARGLTLAPLMADLVAAQATGTPWPVEQDLADAVDPARWLVRQTRAAAGRGQPG
jgi:tRNA 5-methylaminomethyl-2-thiouridine biosynthesis bifunctional protein